MNKVMMSFWSASLLFVGSSAYAQDSSQQVGTPLDLSGLDLSLTYSNDFSGNDKLDFESAMVKGDKRVRRPQADAQWIAEGWGDAKVCGGKLWVAPVKFKACGERAVVDDRGPSHMVVWNKDQYAGDMMFEFTVNHHGSDDGLTLVFFAATGMEGQDIFDLSLPVRDGVYKTYNRGLSNYTVSYWSRNQKAGAVKKGERYSNRVRKNPGMNMLASNPSLTDKCDDCDYKIRILKSEGSITVEINGTIVNHITDASTPHDRGYIGLRSMMGINMVSYDDFKVWTVK